MFVFFWAVVQANGVCTYICCCTLLQLAGLVAASTAAEASNEALKAMLAQDHGAEGGVLDAWLTLSAHKVHFVGIATFCPSLPSRNLCSCRVVYFGVYLTTKREVCCSGKGCGILCHRYKYSSTCFVAVDNAGFRSQFPTE